MRHNSQLQSGTSKLVFNIIIYSLILYNRPSIDHTSSYNGLFCTRVLFYLCLYLNLSISCFNNFLLRNILLRELYLKGSRVYTRVLIQLFWTSARLSRDSNPAEVLFFAIISLQAFEKGGYNKCLLASKIIKLFINLICKLIVYALCFKSDELRRAVRMSRCKRFTNYNWTPRSAAVYTARPTLASLIFVME